MKTQDMMNDIKQYFPNAVCGEDNGRWYVWSDLAHADGLIAIHNTKAETLRIAVDYVRKHCRKV